MLLTTQARATLIHRIRGQICTMYVDKSITMIPVLPARHKG